MMAGLLCLFLAAAPSSDLPETGWEGSVSTAELTTRLDWTAVLRTWRIRGVLACTHAGEVTTCLWVENAWPCGILESVRQPWRTHLREGEGWISSLRLEEKGIQSSHGDSLQFSEGRAWTWVPVPDFETDIPLAVPSRSDFRLDYLSEWDAFAWRRPWVDLLLRPGETMAGSVAGSAPRLRAGSWGSYHPRTGFVANSNEVVASYLQALRGGRTASDPSGRIVFSRYRYAPRTGHYMQPVLPAWRPALPIGSTDIPAVEGGLLSPHGAYLFVHFGLFQVCRKCLPVRLCRARRAP